MTVLLASPGHTRDGDQTLARGAKFPGEVAIAWDVGAGLAPPAPASMEVCEHRED